MPDFNKGDIVKFSGNNFQYKAKRYFKLSQAVEQFNKEYNYIETDIGKTLSDVFEERFCSWLSDNGYISRKPLDRQEVTITARITTDYSFVIAKTNVTETSIVNINLYQYESTVHTEQTHWEMEK
jgi:hypothetical protein